MSKHRDRSIAIGAALMVLVLCGSVVLALQSAERNGRRALERLQLAQLDQLARVLDSALAPSLATPVGLTNPVTNKPWNLVANDPQDAAGLALLQARMPPDTRTGWVLLDATGTVVGGTLLTDPASVGRAYDRNGLATVLRGKASLLPVDTRSLTTPLATIAIARPLPGPAGAATGAILQESDVAPESAFNSIMGSFRRARTDEYSFLDSTGVVISSTKAATVGKKADPVLATSATGFHRHGATVAATADIPSVGWVVAFRQSTKEFEGDLTGPLRSALALLVVIGMFGAGLTFFVLLARLRAARQEQQRLAAINEAREEFISIVSHELRTPATGQLGFLQTLLDHWADLGDDERRQTVGQAYTNARRLHALTRDVLDTASIEAGQLPYAFEVVDLGAAVRGAVAAVPTPDNEVAIAGDTRALSVRADPERVQQVLGNLLDNAIKNSPAGGTVEIRIAATDDGQALLEVSDRGPGITDDEAARAFEKFSRGRHNSVRGTGLGLYICRKIVDAHGGRIWVGRRPDGGATVSFTLPLATAEPATPAEPVLR